MRRAREPHGSPTAGHPPASPARRPCLRPPGARGAPGAGRVPRSRPERGCPPAGRLPAPAGGCRVAQGLLLLLLAGAVLGLGRPAAAGAAESCELLAGAAEADITPRVKSYEDRNGNGRFDMGDPGEAFGLGDPVTAFEEGEIRIGNGEGPARYVYDPLHARALVLENPGSGTRIALVSLDLYMLMFPDVEGIRALVGPDLGLDFILLGSSHTHMGPDTLGISGLQGLSTGGILGVLGRGKAPSGINREWFLRLRQTVARLVREAYESRRPAVLTLAQTTFDFGVRDEREPLILDTDLVVLAVDDRGGEPIATVVQWACHPEAVLLIADPRVHGGEPGSVPEQAREAWGRTLSAGFPGSLCGTLSRERGGITLYFNGALGGMATNLHTFVWDPDEHPAFPATTDPQAVPEEIRIPNDFRFAPVQGREAARRALQALRRDGETFSQACIRVATEQVLVPFQNPFYRLMAALGIVGYEKRELYDAEGSPARGTRPCLRGCFLPTVKFPSGKYARTEVAYVEIGPLGLASVPAELLPELSVGLPADFDSNPDRYFPQHARAHKTGEAYRLMYPPLKRAMKTPYKMVVSLSGDDLGYVIPRSDFDPPHGLWWCPPMAFWWYSSDSETDPHYEESATAGSELEPRLMGALNGLMAPPAPALPEAAGPGTNPAE